MISLTFMPFFFTHLIACQDSLESKISSDTHLENVDTALDTGLFVEEQQSVYSFSFIVLADPHIIGTSDHRQRLHSAVDWINEQVQQNDKNIDLVLVVGDVGWGDGLYPSVEELDRLLIPYVPIIGDNEVSYGSQFEFEIAFEESWQRLTEEFEDFESQIGETYNTELDIQSSFYNVAFTYKNIRFICADWASRESGPILSEIGYLHDFAGGTWPWFEQQILQSAGSSENSVVIASHIPMILAPGGFAMDEMDQISEITLPYTKEIFANFSGHFHANAEIDDGELDVFITDATWDDEVTLRVIDVYQNDYSVQYEQKLEVIPYMIEESMEE